MVILLDVDHIVHIGLFSQKNICEIFSFSQLAKGHTTDKDKINQTPSTLFVLLLFHHSGLTQIRKQHQCIFYKMKNRPVYYYCVWCRYILSLLTFVIGQEIKFLDTYISLHHKKELGIESTIQNRIILQLGWDNKRNLYPEDSSIWRRTSLCSLIVSSSPG